MGGCCGGRNYKIEGKSEVIMKNPIIRNNSVATFSQSESMINPLTLKNVQDKIEKANLAIRILTGNIEKIIDLFPEFDIKPIFLDEIWNISKFYLNDFTLSEYILYDLRDKSLKNENFLKKYKCINYTVDNIENFSPDKTFVFKRFICNKTVIIIISEDKVNLLFQLFQNLNEQRLNQFKVCILAQILREDMLYLNMFSNLYKQFDHVDFPYFPHILIPLRKIFYIKNESYIFIDTLSNSKFTKEKLEEENFIENSQFLIDFKIKIILSIASSNDTFHIENINNSIYYISINLKIIDDHNSSAKLINLIKSYILNQSGLLILFDNKEFPYNSLYKIISFILIKLFYRDFSYPSLCEMLIELIKEIKILFLPPDFIIEISSAIISAYNKETNKHFGLINENSKKQIASNVDGLLNHLSEKKNFLSIINVIERIMLNVLNHPKNPKFYKVKKDSNTFKTNIENNLFAKNIFELFLFEKNEEQKEFYYLKDDTNLTLFQELYDILVYYVRNCLK